LAKSDPIRRFEHSHGRLSGLALEVATQLRATEARSSPKAWEKLGERLMQLRDELLRHFADEEEALFPFVRACVPKKAGAVDRLQSAHDTICGCTVRMVHVAAGERHLPSVLALYERFETAYAKHSAEENRLFEGLGILLDGAQRRELAERLRGL
jgi:iron-sulfur cluster repair protein YtfE (RIC family)